jgi:hypothetical protein
LREKQKNSVAEKGGQKSWTGASTFLMRVASDGTTELAFLNNWTTQVYFPFPLTRGKE